MVTFTVGSIVLIPFPFSDLSGSKLRPALVITSVDHISWAKFIQRLRELGFEGPYAGGRHPYMRRCEVTVIILNPHQGDN